MAPRKIPSKLGCWQIGAEIGRGGMGTVYEAVSTKDGQPAAIKVLSFDLVNDLEYLKRFRREIKAGSSVSSPYVVKVLEWGEESGCYYFAMELLHGGQDLHEVLKADGALIEEQALGIGIELCCALEALHDSSVVHRDIKPGNIMLLPDGGIKLMDLGLARIMDRTALTVTGEALGSPRYMAPEILNGSVADFRSDVYQAGILIYELLAGEPAFDGDNFERLLQIIIEDPPEDIRKKAPEISLTLAYIIEVCLRKNPDERYQTIGELKHQLENLRDGIVEADLSSSGDSLKNIDSLKSSKGDSGKDCLKENAHPKATFLDQSAFFVGTLERLIPPEKMSMILPVFLLSIVGVLVFYLFNTTTILDVDAQVSIMQGLNVVEVRWITAVNCQTQAKVAGHNIPVRSFSNKSEKSVKKHTIFLSDLQPGKKYRLRLYGAKREGPGWSFIRSEKIDPSQFQINRKGDVITVTGLLPSWIKASLVARALGEEFHGVERSVSTRRKQISEDAGSNKVTRSSANGGLNGNGESLEKVVVQINGIPAYCEASSLILTCKDTFGDSVDFELSPLPGTVTMLLASVIDGVALPSAIEAFIGESNRFFADPSIGYERKKKVYDLLVAGDVNPTLLAPFVRWSEYTGSNSDKVISYEPVGVTMPVVIPQNPFLSLAVPLSADTLKSGQLFIFKIEGSVEPLSEAHLNISRRGIGEGARLRIIIGDNFQIIDGENFRNNKLFKVTFPGRCLSGRKLIIVRIVAESLGYLNEDAEKMIIDKLSFSVSSSSD